MATVQWVLDPSHSEIQFKVKHLMISKVTGEFTKFSGSFATQGEDISTANISFKADIGSISTNNEQRDAHLKSSDFFEADKHPELLFESEKLERINDEDYKLYGALTIRGITKNVVLDVAYSGVITDPWGNTRVGFEVTGKINRKDFGISFGMVSETGGVLLGYDVELNAQVQFTKVAKEVAVEVA